MSGLHTTPRIKVGATDEQRARWREAAEIDGAASLAEWLVSLAEDRCSELALVRGVRGVSTPKGPRAKLKKI